MIKIVARSKVAKENLETYIEIARPLVEASQAEEGNVYYTLTQDKSDPEVIAFIEAWKDHEAIDIHNATPHFTEIVPKLGELSSSETIELYEVLI